VENDCDSNLENIKITDLYDKDIEITSEFEGDITDHYVVNEQKIIFNISELGPSDQILITFNATINSDNFNDVYAEAYTSNNGVYVSAEDSVSIIKNIAPIIDKLEGPENGIKNEQYEYTFKGTDEKDDDLFYFIDWGDDSNTGWIGPYASGKEITRSHSWGSEDTYVIDIKVKDNYDLEGDKSKELEVDISDDNDEPSLDITNPIPKSIYLNDRRIPRLLSRGIFVIGKLQITAEAEDEDRIDRLEHIIDDDESSSVEMEKEGSGDNYSYLLNDMCFGKKEIKVIAYDNKGKTTEETLNIFMINFGFK
jgi:hypothetical protein